MLALDADSIGARQTEMLGKMPGPETGVPGWGLLFPDPEYQRIPTKNFRKPKRCRHCRVRGLSKKCFFNLAKMWLLLTT